MKLTKCSDLGWIKSLNAARTIVVKTGIIFNELFKELLNSQAYFYHSDVIVSKFIR